VSSKSKSLLFQSVIEDFVKFREWEDEVNTDLEAQTCRQRGSEMFRND